MARRSTTFVIGGHDVKPSQVRIRDLVYALEKLETAILSVARQQLGALSDEQSFVALTEIREGSDALVLETSPELDAAIVAVAESAAGATFDRLPWEAHEALFDMDKRLTPKYGEWGFNADKVRGIQKFRVSKQKPVSEPREPEYLESTTVVYGWLYEAGGKQPRLAVSIGGRKIKVELSQELAKQAGSKLYTTVGLEGVAYWRPDTLAIEKFKALRLIEHVEGRLLEGLERVAELSGAALAEVNLVEHFKHQREEDKA